MRSLWYTAYVVSSLTFLALAYIEWQIPGFSSSVFPAYVVLLVAIACGIGALVSARRPGRVTAELPGFSDGLNPPLRLSVSTYVFALITGLLLAFVVFDAGEVFGVYRLVLALIALVLPLFLLKALSDVKKD